MSQKAETSTKKEAGQNGNGIGDNETQEQEKCSNIGAVLAPIHYPASPHNKATQWAGGADPMPPIIVSIHSAGAYSAALSSLGDLCTWGCGEANQLGQPQRHLCLLMPFSERGKIY